MSDVVVLRRMSVVTLVAREPSQVNIVGSVAPAPIVTQVTGPVSVVIKRDGIPGVGLKGDKGDQGDQGDPGNAFTFTYQPPSPQTTWVVAHNQDRYPSVTCTDSAGEVVQPNVAYLSRNLVELSFAVPMAGFAHLN